MPSCRRCCQAAYAARVDEDIDPYNLLRTSILGGDHLHRTRRGGYHVKRNIGNTRERTWVTVF